MRYALQCLLSKLATLRSHAVNCCTLRAIAAERFARPARRTRFVHTASRGRGGLWDYLKMVYLNFYLHRAHIAPSAMCSFCQEEETLEHFLLSCRRFSSLRKRYLEFPLRRLGLSLSVPNLLSFGALEISYCNGDVCRALHAYIAESGRLPC